jgi:hypothetical protein
VDPSGASAQDRVDAAAAIVRERLGGHIWAEGDTSWAEAVGGRLEGRGWRLAVEEIGAGGQVATLFGDVPWLALVRVLPAHDGALGATTDDDAGGLRERAATVRDDAGVDAGLAVRVRPRGSEFAVSVAAVTPSGERRQTRATYIGGAMGRSQAALIAAAALFECLGDTADSEPAAPEPT